MMRRLCDVLFFCLVVSLVVGDAAHAQGTNLRQQILPMNCVFEIVDYGTGELRFLTPKECGQVIPPIPAPTPEPTPAQPSQGIIYSYPYAPIVTQASSEPQAINLDTFLPFKTARGYTTSVRAGQTFYFKLDQTSEYLQHVVTVHIQSISDASVKIAVGGIMKLLALHQVVSFDMNHNGQSDFFVGLQSLAGDGTAVLTFRYFEASQLVPILTSPSVDEDVLYVTLAIGAMTGLMYWLWHRRTPLEELIENEKSPKK